MYICTKEKGKFRDRHVKYISSSIAFYGTTESDENL